MENFKTPKHFLFKEGEENLHLHTIFTDLGKKTVYDSAAQCSKCAYCSRTCPAQLETGREDNGPRARNILLRFIMEGKIDRKKNISRIKDVLSGCMLCGMCTKECFAKVTTHEHVLELERVYGPRRLPLSCRMKNKIISLKPGLKNKIKKMDLGGPGAFFLPSFEAKFLEIKSAVNMLNAVKQIFGGVKILWNDGGMREYVYESLPAARSAAAKLMDEYFSSSSGEKIITDSLDIFNFIKKYPQIFFETENFEKAQKFADKIYFMADILPKPQTKIPGKIILNKSAAFCAEDKIFESSDNNYPAWEGENYPLPPPGYERIKPKECRRYIRRKIDFIRAAGADAVVCTTLAQKRLLNKHLKKYYAKCKAVFIGDL